MWWCLWPMPYDNERRDKFNWQIEGNQFNNVYLSTATIRAVLPASFAALIWRGSSSSLIRWLRIFYPWHFCEFLHFYLLQHWYRICFILDFTFIFVHFYIFIFYNIDTGQVPFKFQGFTTFTLFIRFIYAYLNLFIFYNVDKERALKNLIMWLLVYSIGRHQVWNSVLISIALISPIPITKLINK